MRKKYMGYKAYDYLGNYSPLELTCGDERVPEYLIPLTLEQELRVEKLRESNLFIGLHDHIELLPNDIFRDMSAYMKNGRRNTAYSQISRSYYDVVFEGLGGTLSKVSSPCGGKWDDCIYDIGMRSCDISHQDLLVKCETIEDIQKAKENGKIGWVMGMEDAQSIENELDRLDILYGFGLRTIGITYSASNYLASGGQDKSDCGLTGFGVKAIERMNKLGFLIDCAHSSNKTIIQVTEISQSPIVLSHIGARNLWNTNRMATDEALIAVAKNGGLVGVEAAPHTTMVSKDEEHTVYSVMKHFEYVRDLIGIDHVMFGTDLLYGDHVKLHNFAKGSIKSEHLDGMTKVDYVLGMENPTEASKNILRYLVMNNYPDEDIKKVLSGNLLRVLQNTWK